MNFFGRNKNKEKDIKKRKSFDLSKIWSSGTEADADLVEATLSLESVDLKDSSRDIKVPNKNIFSSMGSNQIDDSIRKQPESQLFSSGTQNSEIKYITEPERVEINDEDLLKKNNITIEELNLKLETVLKAMGAEEKQIQKYTKFSVEKKLAAVKAQQEAPIETPEKIVKTWKLSREPETLEKMYHCIKNYPLKWVEDFLYKYEGLDLFADSLLSTNLLLNEEKELDTKIRRRIVVNLYALLNCKIGLNAFIEHDNLIFILVLLFRTSDKYLISKICSIFAVLCRFKPQSKLLVKDALKYYDQVFRSKNRYQRLMELLKSQVDQITKSKVLMLINQLISDPEIMNHFIDLGLREYVIVRNLLDLYEISGNDDLDIQLEHCSDMIEDESEISPVIERMGLSGNWNKFESFREKKEEDDNLIKVEKLETQKVEEEIKLQEIKLEELQNVVKEKDEQSQKIKEVNSTVENVKDEQKIKPETKVEEVKPIVKSTGENPIIPSGGPPTIGPPPMGGPPGLGGPPGPLGMKGPGPSRPSKPLFAPDLKVIKLTEKVKNVRVPKIPDIKLEQSIFIKRGISKDTNTMMDLIDLSEITQSFSAKPSKEKVEKVDNNANILPGDIVQEMLLSVGSLKMAGIGKYEDIYNLILSMPKDRENLIGKLVNSVPYEENMEKVKMYQGDGELNDAEKYAKFLSDLPLLKSRLLSWEAKVKFESNVEYIMIKLGYLIDASKALQTNKNFHQMLGLILAYFNVINGSTKGNSFGFKLDETLSVIPGIKTSDGNSSLLRIIMKSVAINYPHLLKLHKELSILDEAKRCILIESRAGKDKITKEEITVYEGIYPEFDEIKKSISDIDAPLEVYKKLKLENDVYPKIISEFKERGLIVISEIEKKKEEMLTLLNEIINDFTLNPTNTIEKPSEFFKIVFDFLDECKKANDLNQKDADAKKERLRLEKQKVLKEQKRKEREKRLITQKVQTIDDDDDERGLLTNLESDLKSGQAYVEVQ
eukprot:gene1276-11363_t